jgi:hypothetical protein
MIYSEAADILLGKIIPLKTTASASLKNWLLHLINSIICRKFVEARTEKRAQRYQLSLSRERTIQQTHLPI